MQLSLSEKTVGKFLLTLCLAFVLFAFGTHAALAQSSQTDIRNFIFGHSLVYHEHVQNQPASYELAVPHWLHLLAAEAGNSYRADGEYGNMLNHSQNLPPDSAWNIPNVTGLFNGNNGETFVDGNFNTTLLTPSNFIQWQGPNTNYYGESVTPVQAALTVIDWVEATEPGTEMVVYQSWPDMGSYAPSWPANASQFSAYNTYAQNGWNTWWTDYMNSLTAARPNLDIRMIPVGNVLSKVFTDTAVNTVTAAELFEDNAPHGRPTTYFLASLIVYMDLYEEKAPASFTIPTTIHPTVRNNYQDIVDFIWVELGNSGTTTPTDIDNDGVVDSADNCPNNANADQADNDNDGIGNVCDSTPNGETPTDTDGDGVADSVDNCPAVANTDQADNDNDGIGNVCDSTPNGNSTSTIAATTDYYTTNASGPIYLVNVLSNDTTQSGTLSVTGVLDRTNGAGGGVEIESDGSFYLEPAGGEGVVTYTYTVTNGTETTTGEVVVTKSSTYNPFDPNNPSQGVGPTPPTDTDNDGVADSTDNCPNTANADQADNDNDGIGNVCDATPNGNTATNTAPVAGNDQFSTDADTVLVDLNVLANDTDADGDLLNTLTASTSGSNGGVFTLNASGTLTFNPVNDFSTLLTTESATTSLTYTVTDGEDTDTAIVIITVTGTVTPIVDTDGDGVEDSVDNCPNTTNADQADNDNDGIGNVCDPTPNGETGGNSAPTVVDDSYSYTVTPNMGLFGLNVLDNDSDADGDSISVVNNQYDLGNNGGTFILNSSGGLVFDPDGQFDYLAPGQTITTSINYVVTDGTDTTTGTISVVVTGS